MASRETGLRINKVLFTWLLLLAAPAGFLYWSGRAVPMETLVFLGYSILTFLLIGVWLGRRVTRPLNKLIEVVN